MLQVVALMVEKNKGDQSKWALYIKNMPDNVTSMAWYWTEEEMRCAVRRPGMLDSAGIQKTLANFHLAFKQLATKSPLIASLPQPTLAQEAEWAYMMVRTRTF